MGGGAAHLWGAPDKGVEGALLAAAVGLGGPLVVSEPAEEALQSSAELVHYAILDQ